MKITHDIPFAFELALDSQAAINFVRDAKVSLSEAHFIDDLTSWQEGDGSHVKARMQVNAAMFGQRELYFESQLVPTPKGARLIGLPLDNQDIGWAQVSGEAWVTPLPQGAHVRYHFEITVYLNLPEPEKWGGRALLKMVEFTAQKTVERITSQFPEAVQQAAHLYELRHGSKLSS